MTPMPIEPLQTHGLKVWATPLPGRFVTYDESDRAWMEPLGLGRMVLDSLYDVRDVDFTLVGYTRARPTYERRSIQIGLVESAIGSVAYRPCIILEQPKFRTIEIRTHLVHWDGDPRVCWVVSPSVACDLILTPFIVAIGEDRKHKALHDYRYEKMRHHRQCYPLW